jgi:hypothetical protein
MSSLALLEAVFHHVDLVLLTAATGFSLVAARGFRGTPWGRVLGPIPVVAGGFLAATVLLTLPLSTATISPYLAVSWAVAIGAMAWSAVEYWRVMSGRVIAA